jgi:iron complex outermembrane receptor protein
LTDGKTSKGLDGEYTVEEGFQKLLSGSGLMYTITADNAVAIKVAELGSDEVSTLPALKVSGKVVYGANAEHDPNDPYNDNYRHPNSSTATKTDTPIMETPFSVKAVTQQVMEDQQVTRVDKAVENVAGVIRSGANGLQRDTFTIRGFDTGGAGNTYRNGVIFSQS